jgi:hypothetical protein
VEYCACLWNLLMFGRADASGAAPTIPAILYGEL